MTAITINILNHEVSFFKKMISKMGWTYSEADVVQTKATPKEQALAKVDHAFGQLKQMQEGKIIMERCGLCRVMARLCGRRAR